MVAKPVKAEVKVLEKAALETFAALSSIPGPERIDRENRVIRDVKVAGLESVNTARVLGLPLEWGDALDKTYSYLESALQEALPLYEGSRVYLDHPETQIDESGRRVISSSDRKVADHFGRLRELRFVPGDGIRGNLEYLEKHPLAEKVLETAARMSEQLALSHRAFLEPVLVAGRVVVRAIRRVLSVDLITENPGTTVTLFESAVQMIPGRMTPAAQEEEMAGGAPVAPAADPNKPTAPAQEEGAGEPAGGGSPTDLVMQGLQAAAMAIIQQPGTSADKISQLTPILEQMDQVQAVLGGGSSGDGGGAGAGDGGGSGTAESRAKGKTPAGQAQATESTMIRRLAQLEAEKAARQTLESAGVKANETRVTALAAMPKASQAALLAEFKTADTRLSVESGDIFSSRGGRQALESGGDDLVPSLEVNGKAFAASLRG